LLMQRGLQYTAEQAADYFLEILADLHPPLRRLIKPGKA
jgi:hypothetical protein